MLGVGVSPRPDNERERPGRLQAKIKRSAEPAALVRSYRGSHEEKREGLTTGYDGRKIAGVLSSVLKGES